MKVSRSPAVFHILDWQITAERLPRERLAVQTGARPSPWRMVVALGIFALYLGLTIYSLTAPKDNQDWVYYDYLDMPAPCPPPAKGYWPRDCH